MDIGVPPLMHTFRQHLNPVTQESNAPSEVFFLVLCSAFMLVLLVLLFSPGSRSAPHQTPGSVAPARPVSSLSQPSAQTHPATSTPILTAAPIRRKPSPLHPVNAPIPPKMRVLR